MSYRKTSFPSDPDVFSVFRHELARTAAMHGPVDAGPVVWPRFVGYYEGLARLPRRLRRALKRRSRCSLGGPALLLALGQAPALAATIAVDGAICTLVDAITAANGDQPTAGGCTGGNGADTLVLPAGSTHTLIEVNDSVYGPTGLPLVTSAITIEGNGSTITRASTAPFRLLAIGTGGDLTLQDTRLSGGAVTGFEFPDTSDGGVFNMPGGTLTLTHGTVAGNSAEGSGGGVHNSGILTLTHGTVQRIRRVMPGACSTPTAAPWRWRIAPCRAIRPVGAAVALGDAPRDRRVAGRPSWRSWRCRGRQVG